MNTVFRRLLLLKCHFFIFLRYKMDSIEPVHPKRDREINAGRNESEREPSGSSEEGGDDVCREIRYPSYILSLAIDWVQCREHVIDKVCVSRTKVFRFAVGSNKNSLIS